MNKQEWASAIKSFAQAQRQQRPAPDRVALSEEEERCCQIIGGEFVSWLQRDMRNILKQRTFFHKVMRFDPNPLIILTTTAPGLVALQEIIPAPPDHVVYLMHSEFEEWEQAHPVDQFTFHIHHWSYFRPLDEALLARAQEAYPYVKPEEYRVHTSGDLWGENCGGEANHLWRWNGHDMELLEEAFSQVRF